MVALKLYRSVDGGSLGLNLLAYEPVKAWSTASWRAVEVVRRVKRGRRVFRPRSSFSIATAADHKGWLTLEGVLRFAKRGPTWTRIMWMQPLITQL
jgi:hypothetical protein